MEEEEEWESELAENIRSFCAISSDATAIIVDGTVVRKRNGLVLISGGFGGRYSINSTEIFDSTNNTVRKGPDMELGRYDHASASLPTGDVAVFGGFSLHTSLRWMSSCEVLDAKISSFKEISHMIDTRDVFAAILLQNGLVLLSGGNNSFRYVDSCELYNPADKTFSPSQAKMTIARGFHTASLLLDGRVLVCGGSGGACNTFQISEIYDPTTDSFSAGPSMIEARYFHTATTLLDGKVLVTGGVNGDRCNSTEFYDPTTNSFSKGPQMVVARCCHFSALLPDGRVLIGGGESYDSQKTTEIYDPMIDSFTTGVDLLHARSHASAALF